MSSPSQHPANRLADETSPYLLQHAHNPVDWYPWGEEALQRARDEQKPIFLSVGYSACHWCHVMERESFENEAIAKLMNEHFVNVKVDREERPDIDEIYMKAVQMMTGSGGWPMSVFLTPELEPYYGGTYFPPFQKYGRPGFADVLLSLAKAWEEKREQVVQQGAKLREHIAKEGEVDTRGKVGAEMLDRSFEALRERFDPTWGGFGDAPKFPHASDLRVMLRHWIRTGKPEALQMVTFTLDKMAGGGIHDQLGGGFHRYSTDEKWLIPHFEKMLYDNALLVPAYLEAYLATGDTRHAEVARDCCEWVLREMISAEGAFASTQDADTEGEEGKFFVWTPEELEAVLGKKLARVAQEYWDVTDDGNFEHGTSALWRPRAAEEVAAELKLDPSTLAEQVAEARSRLFEAREKRVKPGWDDKVLVAWNGLMLSAMSQAAQVLEEPRFLEAARRAAGVVLDQMTQPDGRLVATMRGGKAHLDGCLDDYAFLIQGLCDLYETDFDQRWLREALRLTEVLEEQFHDGKHGGYFTTGKDHEELIARLKNPHDGALPSGNAVHALNLLRLAEWTTSSELRERASSTIEALGGLIGRYPAAFSQLMIAFDFQHSSPREIVLAGTPGEESFETLARTVRQSFTPQRVVTHAAPDGSSSELLPLTEGREAGPGVALAYVCRSFACREPIADPTELLGELTEG